MARERFTPDNLKEDPKPRAVRAGGKAQPWPSEGLSSHHAIHEAASGDAIAGWPVHAVRLVHGAKARKLRRNVPWSDRQGPAKSENQIAADGIANSMRARGARKGVNTRGQEQDCEGQKPKSAAAEVLRPGYGMHGRGSGTSPARNRKSAMNDPSRAVLQMEARGTKVKPQGPGVLFRVGAKWTSKAEAGWSVGRQPVESRDAASER